MLNPIEEVNDSICIICNRMPPYSMWLYVWNGKSGYACEKCGQQFHAIGDYLCLRAAEYLKVQGVDVMYWKEKFGEWRLDTQAKTDREKMLVKDLEKQYSILFPEFAWCFW